MRSRFLRAAAFVTLAGLASACSDSTAPSSVQPAELSQVLAELQPSSLDALGSQISAAPAVGLSAPVPSSCTYDSGTKSFICPNVSVTGITVTRSFTLLDAGGNPQSAFDKATTAAVRMKTTFAGTVTSGSTTLVINQQQDHTLSGLLTGVHTLNGTTLGTAAGTVGNGAGVTTPMTTTVTTTITNLVLPQSSTGADRWPKSGTIDATSTVTIGALPAVTTKATITFNGTNLATATLTSLGHTTTCTFDLSGAKATVCTG
jgi:hypothetical protein